MVGGGDDFGHGTWVAGIIAARANNGKGIAGVAPKAKILSIKTLDKEGVGTIDDVARAVLFATEHGAKVINLSLGSDLPTSAVLGLVTGLLGGEDPLQKAINFAAGQGAAVIAAAGNNGLASGFVGIRNLTLVGATGPNDEIAGYSSSLIGVTLHAPGGDASGECDPSRCILTTDMKGEWMAHRWRDSVAQSTPRRPCRACPVTRAPPAPPEPRASRASPGRPVSPDFPTWASPTWASPTWVSPASPTSAAGSTSRRSMPSPV